MSEQAATDRESSGSIKPTPRARRRVEAQQVKVLKVDKWTRQVWGTYWHEDGRRSARHFREKSATALDPKPWYLFVDGIERGRYRTINALVAENP